MPDPQKRRVKPQSPPWLGLLLIAAVVLLLIWPRLRPPGEGSMPVAAGTPLPEIFAAGWLNASKGIPSAESLRGHVVLVDCWASWCAPCREEMPHLARIAGHWQPRGVRFLGLSPEAEPGPIEAFIKTVDRFDWPVAYGANMPIDLLGIPGFPTLILFDTRGRAVWSGHGTDGLEEAIEKVVEP